MQNRFANFNQKMDIQQEDTQKKVTLEEINFEKLQKDITSLNEQFNIRSAENAGTLPGGIGVGDENQVDYAKLKRTEPECSNDFFYMDVTKNEKNDDVKKGENVEGNNDDGTKKVRNYQGFKSKLKLGRNFYK